MEELEAQVLQIAKAKHIKSGGNNGNLFGEFDEILKMSIEDRNAFLERMVEKKLIRIAIGPNARMVMMPK